MTIPESASLQYPTTESGEVIVGKTLFLNMKNEPVILDDGTVVPAGQFAVRNGRLVTIEGVAALKMWIEKILRTERNRFRVYDILD